MKNVICNNCGWVHFEVSVEYVLKWQDGWIDHWLSLNDESRKNYGVLDRPPSYKSEYLCCGRCGGSYKNFRDAIPEEVPYGSTIGGIITREAKFE